MEIVKTCLDIDVVRNKWSRFTIAGCGLHCFVSALFGSFWVVNNFSAAEIFKYLFFTTIKSHTMVRKPPEKILGMPGLKKFWMPWGKAQKRIPRKTSLAKFNFRKSGEGHGPPALSFSPLPPSSSSGALVCTIKKQNNFIFSSQVTLTCQMWFTSIGGYVIIAQSPLFNSY